jgi:hypothetical protein
MTQTAKKIEAAPFSYDSDSRNIGFGGPLVPPPIRQIKFPTNISTVFYAICSAILWGFGGMCLPQKSEF